MKVEENNNYKNKIHTFAICAYKDSPHLEDCVKSVLNQSSKSNIIICTSTPSNYIEDIANRYHLEYFIKSTKSDIQDDWNFAYNHVKTELATVTHQDDIYHMDYVKTLLSMYKKHKDMSIFITNYMPIDEKGEIKKDLNSVIKRLLKFPLKFSFLSNKKLVKRRILSLGNCISCPSVTYNKNRLGDSIFSSELKFSLDWDTFLKIANMNGRFVYADQELISYRVYSGATTKEFIVNHTREKEDVYMFNKFWPKWLTRLIMKYYKNAYDTYR